MTFLIAFAFPILIVACSAVIRGIVRGVQKEDDWNLGIEFTLAGIVTAIGYTLDQLKIVGTLKKIAPDRLEELARELPDSIFAEADPLGQAVSAIGYAVFGGMLFLGLVGLHQWFEPKPPSGRRTFWLKFGSNTVGILYLGCFLVFIKGTK